MVSVKIILVCASFAFLHSLMASSWFKGKVQFWISEKFYRVYYRLVYNTFSLFLVILGAAYVNSLPNEVWWDLKQLDLLLFFIRLSGLVLIFFALRKTNMGYFSGVGQIVDYLNAQVEQKTLITGGVYRLCRHPLYLGSMVFVWSRSHMTRSFFLLALSITLYCYLGSLREEKRLAEEFGDAYRLYQQTTSRFFPNFSLHNRS